jgi:hypothetical protein
MVDVAEPAPAANRLQEAISRLRIQAVRTGANDRALLVAGGAIGAVGLVVVVLGWYGAAHTITLQEQVPYLISGGLLGLALVFLGGFLYFAYWLTQLVQEQRKQTVALVDALNSLTITDEPNGAAPVTTATATSGALVATAKGTMSHRPDCAVVANKRGLRKVTARDNLEPCKLCQPG